MSPRYTEDEAREAIAASSNWTETLRRLGLCPSGGKHAVLRRWADEVWSIPTSHFDPDLARHRGLAHQAMPLEAVLVRDSDYSRSMVKQRLYAAGLKQRRCELCGQGEVWRGERLALILDHINGERRDNRLENLRIVCPNCAATLDTHCGRKNHVPSSARACERCQEPFMPKRTEQRFCSRACGQRAPRASGARPDFRRVVRPPYEQLLVEVRADGWSAVGRRYGVSDNAVRKWVRSYERERASGPAVAGGGGEAAEDAGQLARSSREAEVPGHLGGAELGVQLE